MTDPGPAQAGVSRSQPVDTVEEVIRSIRQIVRAVGLFGRDLWADWKISPSQLAALEAVAERGPMSAGALAEFMGVSPATVTRLVDGLEDRDLVERTRGRRDRRKVEISSTPRGVTLLDEVPRPLQSVLEKRLDMLPDDRRSAVLQGLRDLVVMLGAEDVEAAPILSVEPHLDASEPTGR